MKHAFVVVMDFAEDVSAKETQKAIRKALKEASVDSGLASAVTGETQMVKPTGVKVISIGEQ